MPLARPTQKILGDNCDSIYCFTQTRGDQSYRIWGNRSDACCLSFCAYASEPDGSWSDSLAANINHTHIDFGADGSFEIFLGPDEPDEPNRFKTAARAVCVISREYYFERDSDRVAEIYIENTADVPAPGPETDANLSEKLRAVGNFVSQTAAMVPPPGSEEHNMLGDLFGFDPDGMGWGTPDNVYALGTFDLSDDEVLVIRGRSPKCCYWGVQTWNAYMQSLELLRADPERGPLRAAAFAPSQPPHCDCVRCESCSVSAIRRPHSAPNHPRRLELGPVGAPSPSW